jgi:hypothetical protein
VLASWRVVQIVCLQAMQPYTLFHAPLHMEQGVDGFCLQIAMLRRKSQAFFEERHWSHEWFCLRARRIVEVPSLCDRIVLASWTMFAAAGGALQAGPISSLVLS